MPVKPNKERQKAYHRVPFSSPLLDGRGAGGEGGTAPSWVMPAIETQTLH